MVNFKICLENITTYSSIVYTTYNRYAFKDFWNQLISFCHLLVEPWCVSGYFNIISIASKRHGGYTQNANAIKDFNNMVLDCNLVDIGYIGNNFTWNNNRVWQRPDKTLFNLSWINK